MRNSKMLFKHLVIIIFSISTCLAYPVNKTYHAAANNQPIKNLDNPVEDKIEKEEHIPLNYIGIAFYKPTYVLPFYYTGSPYNSVYTNFTPHNEQLKHTEFKYQLSLKVPLWKDILSYSSSLYFAYSQLTYWQLYNKTSFIRETDYEPEFFLANEIYQPIKGKWYLNFFNVGYDHQSNGNGNDLQRGWDRIYVEAITSTDDWMLSLRPWIIVATNSHNDNVGSYLGYAKFLAAYKLHQQVFSFEITNLLAVPKRTTVNLTWSFPITPYLKGYAEIFSGYGQSLIEYNHRTNSAGIGLALNDWI